MDKFSWRIGGWAFCCFFWVALVAPAADRIHENSFSGKRVSFIRGAENVKLTEKTHELSETRTRSLPTSEHIVVSTIVNRAGGTYAYYYYPTPKALVSEELTAALWVHSNKPGVRLLMRLVLPKERNPNRIEEPLTTVVQVDTYKGPAGGWQRLTLRRPLDLLQAEKTALQLKLKKPIDTTGAYVDQLLLDLHTGPGETEVYLDNLEISPVESEPIVKDPKINPPVKTHLAIPVAFDRNRILVGNKQFLPRFIRYTGIPLSVIHASGMNSLYVDGTAPKDVLENAINNYQFWLIANLAPLMPKENPRVPGVLMANDTDTLIGAISKFQSLDGVLYWDLGSLEKKDLSSVITTTEAIRRADPLRPIAGDIWDGNESFSSALNLTGFHRMPLHSTMELDNYAQWMQERQRLAIGSRFSWTWIQTHMPEHQLRMLYQKGSDDRFDHPVGPAPEQIRLLTYLAVANGMKGLGFWSDRFLGDALTGKSRMLQLALLNQELEMLQPVLLTANGRPEWITTSDPNVRAAVIRSPKGILVLPIWIGSGSQCVPPQGAVKNLKIVVPQVPDGTAPWEITPVRVQSIHANTRVVPGGMEVTIAEFDLTSLVVFTGDLQTGGWIENWQNHTKRIRSHAASWACDLAEEQYRQTVFTHELLKGRAPKVEKAEYLLHDAYKRLLQAQRDRQGGNDESAYLEAMRVLRPLRVLQRIYWDDATASTTYAGASPFAISYHTLPQHWELARQVYASETGQNLLPTGNFDHLLPRGKEIDVKDLIGWEVQQLTNDPVVMRASLIEASSVEDPKPVRDTTRLPYDPTSPLKKSFPPEDPRPNLGQTVLKLEMLPKPVPKVEGEDPPYEPLALDKSFLSVTSPEIRHAPGQWVRITGWMKIPAGIRASADGAMIYDSVGGETLAVRQRGPSTWKKFVLYRQVPANGSIRVRLALTGMGTAYFDQIQVEPLIFRK
ncbi:MAG: hypothetical protein R3B84_24280 [Zavarzinella sp.]